MYIQGFIVPVPEGNREEYRRVATYFADIMKDYGLVEDVEAWEVDVPDGKQTDFRRAVKIEEGEKVVFSWLVWPDRATCDAAHKQIENDPRFKEFGEDMPFDGKRMVFGGFEPLITFGRQ